MSAQDTPRAYTALEFLAHVTVVSQNTGWMAGVGSSETAGMIISYLAAHPDELPAFMEGGMCNLGPNQPGFKLHIEGCLSWHGMDGAIHHPEDVRAMLAERAKGQS